MIDQHRNVRCEMEWTSSCVLCGVLQEIRAYLNEWIDNSNIRTGIEHFVEVGLPVDKF